jgi:hypothetical protein
MLLMFMEIMISSLVQKYKLIDIKSNLNQMFDLFICSCSFEERRLSVARNINNNVRDVALMYNKLVRQPGWLSHSLAVFQAFSFTKLRFLMEVGAETEVSKQRYY